MIELIRMNIEEKLVQTISQVVKEKYQVELESPNMYQVGCSPTSRDFLTGGQWKDVCPTLCARDYKDPKVVVVPDMRGVRNE